MEHLTFTTDEQFQCWLAAMGDFLDEFRSQFSIAEIKRLDLSSASLNLVEAWIVNNYLDTDQMLQPSQARKVNGVACYVGEVFRNTIGGQWEIRLDDPSFAFYALPILRRTTKVVCPLALATAAADRRTGAYLGTVLKNLMGS